MTLKERITATIAAEGPIPFERFMAMSLYDKEGFFGGETLRSEKAGDFLTSPEVSPLFGATLARFVEEENSRIGAPFQLVEVGAGTGSLLRALLGESSVDALAVEVSPAARKSIDPIPVAETLPTELRGVVLANELLDNLPMALAQRVDGEWRERWVGLVSGNLEFVDIAPRPEVVAWLTQNAGAVPEGGWVEVQLAAEAWLRDCVSRLISGAIVLIDYGDTAENLLPRRKDGTLRTYQAHHLGPHPLDEPGATDITADVNFTALLRVVETFDHELVRQDDLLSRLGLRDSLSEYRMGELEAARRGDDQERIRFRSLKTEAETLLHPRGLGDFKALIVRK